MAGERFHRDEFEMAAAYLYHLARNHPFVDGNKRVAAAAAFVFLWFNGWELATAEELEFEQLVRDAASGRLEKPAIAEFLRRHSRAREGGEPAGEGASGAS